MAKYIRKQADANVENQENSLVEVNVAPDGGNDNKPNNKIVEKMKNVKLNLAGVKVVEKWKIWFSIPMAIVIIALIMFSIFAGVNKDASKGMNIGIDFTGGNIVTVQFAENLTDATYKSNLKVIEDILDNHKADISYDQKSGEDSIVIRFGLLAVGEDGNQKPELNDAIIADIELALDAKIALNDEGFKEVSVQYIGPSASSELVGYAFLSVVISTVLILLYIVLRFRNLATGFAAVLALIHDILMVLAFTVIFNIQINSAFIAAIITIIAYSINNTIVLFDRVRENYKAIPLGMDINDKYVVNKSIAQTLSRSIITTITTMVAIVLLAILGVASIREFALPVIFGLIAGTFSSVFMAPSIYCLIKDGNDKRKIRNKNKPPKQKKLKESKAVIVDAVIEEEPTV